MPSSNRDRVVDCMEEFVKYTIVMRPHFELFGDRYSERTARKATAQKKPETDLKPEAEATSAPPQTRNADEPKARKDVVNGVDLRAI